MTTKKQTTKKRIVIAYESLQSLIDSGKSIVTTPKAEDALLKLLDLADEVEVAIAEAKRVIEVKALELNPNFVSIKSDRLRIMYRSHGSKYAIDESKLDCLPEGTFKVKTTYSPDSKVIDAFTKEHGNLPDGIIVPERKKSIQITRLDRETYDIDN